MKLLFLSTLLVISNQLNAQQGAMPLTLSFPFHMDTIEEHEPTFSWQTNLATIESDSRITQRFVLTELGENQTRSEAIQLNQPIMIVDNCETSSLPFSASSDELEDGKTYVWQVSVVNSGAIVQVSEVSQFTLGKESSVANYLPLRAKLNTYPYTVNGSTLRVSLTSVKELKLTATVRSEKGEVKEVTFTEFIDGEAVEQATSKSSTDTRFFELDLKEHKLKKGIYTLVWSPVKGENYELLFERK